MSPFPDDHDLLEQATAELAKDEAKSDQEPRCKLDRSSRAWRNRQTRRV